MSPLRKGTMVSSVQSDELRKKGLLPGMSVLGVNDDDVQYLELPDLLEILSEAQFPLVLRFSRESHIRTGEKVQVEYKDEWYNCTIDAAEIDRQRIRVSYDDKPFRFRNIENLSFEELGRIRKPRGIDGKSPFSSTSEI